MAMKFYYRINENDNIIDWCQFDKAEKVPKFIKEQYFETDRKIIKLVNGTFAFEDEVNLEEEAVKKAKKEFNNAKNAKLVELKSTRDSLEVEPIEYNGNLFDYDEKARERISAAIIALDVSKGQIAWTTADNTEVMVNADDLRGVIAAVAVRSNQLHAKYRELKEQVLACTTAEEVAEIVW